MSLWLQPGGTEELYYTTQPRPTLSKWKERPSCLPPTFCVTTTSRALSLQLMTCCAPVAISSLLNGLQVKLCQSLVYSLMSCKYELKKLRHIS